MARSPADVFKEAIRRAVADLFPELGRSTNVTIRAKVVKVDAVAAGRSYPYQVWNLNRKNRGIPDAS